MEGDLGLKMDPAPHKIHGQLLFRVSIKNSDLFFVFSVQQHAFMCKLVHICKLLMN